MPTMYRTINGVNTKVKKRYAVIGGVNTQVKKRYAVIGGKNTLVYSAAPGFIFNSGDITAETGGWSSTKTMNSGATGGLSVGSVLDVYIKGAPSDQRVTAFPKNKIDISGVDVISLTLTNSFYINCGGAANEWGVRWGIGLSSAKPTAGMRYSDFTHKSYKSILGGNTDLGNPSRLQVASGVVTLDTSNIDGSYYVCVFVDGYDWWGDSGLQVDFKFNYIKCS